MHRRRWRFLSSAANGCRTGSSPAFQSPLIAYFGPSWSSFEPHSSKLEKEAREKEEKSRDDKHHCFFPPHFTTTISTSLSPLVPSKIPRPPNCLPSSTVSPHLQLSVSSLFLLNSRGIWLGTSKEKREHSPVAQKRQRIHHLLEQANCAPCAKHARASLLLFFAHKTTSLYRERSLCALNC